MANPLTGDCRAPSERQHDQPPARRPPSERLLEPQAAELSAQRADPHWRRSCDRRRARPGARSGGRAAGRVDPWRDRPLPAGGRSAGLVRARLRQQAFPGLRPWHCARGVSARGYRPTLRRLVTRRGGLSLGSRREGVRAVRGHSRRRFEPARFAGRRRGHQHRCGGCRQRSQGDAPGRRPPGDPIYRNAASGGQALPTRRHAQPQRAGQWHRRGDRDRALWRARRQHRQRQHRPARRRRFGSRTQRQLPHVGGVTIARSNPRLTGQCRSISKRQSTCPTSTRFIT
jgi:hypothetical protein